MKILVLGASGGCGREVVIQGVERGHTITALVREKTSFNPPEEVEVIRGNVLDNQLIQNITKGKKAIISCLGLKRANKLNPWSKIVSPVNLTSKVVKHLVSNLEVNTKVAVISAAGVAKSFYKTNPVLKFLIKKSNLGPAYQDLEEMELILTKNNLDWYAVRPVTLTDFKIKSVRESDSYGLFDTISRASVASYLLDIIEGNQTSESRAMIIKNSLFDQG